MSSVPILSAPNRRDHACLLVPDQPVRWRGGAAISACRAALGSIALAKHCQNRAGLIADGFWRKSAVRIGLQKELELVSFA